MKAGAVKAGAVTLLLAPAAGLVALTGTALMSVTSVLGGGETGPAGAAAIATVPAPMLALYVEAAAGTCPGLPWQVLAAIGTVESDNGASTAPGVHSGANSAGAEGPMQFEPATFGEYDQPVPAGGVQPPSPYDPTDAVWAAARMLCADGAAQGDLQAAVYAYNHSSAYVADVLTLAASYGMPAGGTLGTTGGTSTSPASTSSSTVDVVLGAALSQLGVRYVYGGDTPGVALDCSALVQYAYGVAGISLPRTTFEQAAEGVEVPMSQAEPGDLLFFAGGDPVEPLGHVGIYLGDGQMVDAPHTGAVVSIESFAPASVEEVRRIITS